MQNLFKIPKHKQAQCVWYTYLVAFIDDIWNLIENHKAEE